MNQLQLGKENALDAVFKRTENEPLRSLKLYNHGEGPYWASILLDHKDR